MHLAHEVVHLLERRVRRADDDVDAVAEHGQLVVGDEGGDLDERVGLERQPGHLAVDPDDAVGLCAVGARGGHGGHARARRVGSPPAVRAATALGSRAMSGDLATRPPAPDGRARPDDPAGPARLAAHRRRRRRVPARRAGRGGLPRGDLRGPDRAAGARRGASCRSASSSRPSCGSTGSSPSRPATSSAPSSGAPSSRRSSRRCSTPAPSPSSRRRPTRPRRWRRPRCSSRRSSRRRAKGALVLLVWWLAPARVRRHHRRHGLRGHLRGGVRLHREHPLPRAVPTPTVAARRSPARSSPGACCRPSRTRCSPILTGIGIGVAATSRTWLPRVVGPGRRLPPRGARARPVEPRRSVRWAGPGRGLPARRGAGLPRVPRVRGVGAAPRGPPHRPVPAPLRGCRVALARRGRDALVDAAAPGGPGLGAGQHRRRRAGGDARLPGHRERARPAPPPDAPLGRGRRTRWAGAELLGAARRGQFVGLHGADPACRSGAMPRHAPSDPVPPLDIAHRRSARSWSALRRRLHGIPELGLHLPDTQAAVLEALSGLDLEVTAGGVAELGRGGPARDGHRCRGSGRWCCCAATWTPCR